MSYLRHFAVLSVLLTACASTPPPAHFTGSPPIRYPSAAWLTAVAESRDSLDDAEQKARLALIRRISLQVSEVYERVESEVREGNRHIAADTTTATIREETSFSRANLIEIADRGTYGGTHYALAVLSRAKVGEALAGEYRAAAQGFRELVAQAKLSEADPARFTAVYREAKAGFRQLGPLALELAAVDPSKESDVREDLRLFGELRASRARVLASVAVRIVAKGSDEAAERVSAAIAREIGALGVRVGQGEAATTLTLEVEERWPRGLALCAEWAPRVTLNDQPVPLEATVVGCTRGRNRSHARDDAASQLTPDLLRPALREALLHVVPLEG